MNKKVLVTICLAVLVLVSGILAIVLVNAASAFKPLASGPQSRGTVSGNGGNAVSVDGWLYFIGNYYTDVNEIKYKDNEYNRLPRDNFGAIYRVKLNSQAQPDYEMLDDESGENPYAAKGCEVVVPKIAGYEKSAIWVYGEYLIYTSPNNNMSRLGELQVNKVDFFRVNLNGSNNRKIYTTETDLVTLKDFTVVYPSENHMYLLVNDGGRLVRVNILDRNFGKVEEISKTSLSFAFPVVTSFENSSIQSNGTQTSPFFDRESSFNDGVMKYVYYTVAREEDDRLSGNIVKRYDIQNGGESETLAQGVNKEYTILAMGAGRLIYAIKNLKGDTDNAIYLTTREGTIGEPEDLLNYVNNPDLAEAYYLPTETTGTSKTPTYFLGLNGATLSIYRSENNYEIQGIAYSPTLAASRKVDIITDVNKIISVTRSRLYYLTGANEVRAINLDDGRPAGNTLNHSALQSVAASNTVSHFRISGYGDRIFFIKTFSEGENTTNIAVMVEFFGEEKPYEFVLGVVGEDYLHDEDDGHTH